MAINMQIGGDIVKTRIRQIRKNADLTQEAFAQRLGIKRNTVTTYETTNKIPMDSIITSICREFNVNEEWLRTGQGEMYCLSDSDDDFQAVMEEIGVKDPKARQIILDYWHLNSSDKEVFWRFVDRFMKK